MYQKTFEETKLHEIQTYSVHIPYRVGQLNFHPSPLKFAPPKMTQNYMKYIMDYDLQHYESF